MAWMTADQLRAFDAGLTNASTYDAATVTAVITDAEQIIERIIGIAYNSRTATNEWHLGDGGVWLRLDNRWPTAVSAASIDGTALSAGALAGLVLDRQTGRVKLASGWTAEAAVLITYTYGQTAPPADLLRAAKILCRALLAEQVSPVIDRSTFYAAEGGGMFRVAQPTATTTGVPAVDAVLARFLVPGIA